MSLPTITSLEQMLPALKIWQQKLNSVLNSPVAPHAPFNFAASGGATGATGITLSWAIVKGADGYELQFSTNGNFSTAAIIGILGRIDATSFFDSTTVTSVKRYYRVRATAGTKNQPHSVKGAWSAPISVTSGSGATTYDSTSHTSGRTGWNRPINSGAGSRFFSP